MEIDNLKNIWKVQKTASYDKETILKMLHKRSSSIAMWIFIISIIELAFGLLINLFTSENLNEEFSEEAIRFMEFTPYIFYAVIFLFIGLFFRNYRQIKANMNISQLMQNIIKTRKTVHYYIYFNISFLILSTLVVLSMNLNKMLDHSFNSWTTLGVIIGTLVTLSIFVLLFWLFYRLIYGILLRRLQQNYQEIKKLQ